MTDHLDAPTRRRVLQTGTAAEAVTAFGATAHVPAYADPAPGAAVTTSQSCPVAGAWVGV